MMYEDAVAYIESRAVFGSRPGFERIHVLLDRLGHPEKGLRYVHVAGTNGKGSVSAEVANILTAAGYRTGLFTSPYVSDFRERITVSGRFIEKERLAKLTAKVQSVVAELDKEGIEATEFEVITAIAFLFFRDIACDIVVLEVGLGGLLDSTNVIERPVVCAITSLSKDHMAVLGNSIEEIAEQKAGIIKRNCPVVSASDQPDSALRVLASAAGQKNAAFYVADPSQIEVLKECASGTLIKIEDTEMRLPMMGAHQITNLAVTLEIIKVLRSKGYNIGTKAIKKGVEGTRLPARQERLHDEPFILLDGGHNAAGVAALKNVTERFLSDKKQIYVIGVLKDKEVSKILKQILPSAAQVFTATPNSDRAMTAEDLKREIEQSGIYQGPVSAVDDPKEAFDKAYAAAKPENAVIVCGSLYLAGDVRSHILEVLGKA